VVVRESALGVNVPVPDVVQVPPLANCTLPDNGTDDTMHIEPLVPGSTIGIGEIVTNWIIVSAQAESFIGMNVTV